MRVVSNVTLVHGRGGGGRPRAGHRPSLDPIRIVYVRTYTAQCTLSTTQLPESACSTMHLTSMMRLKLGMNLEGTCGNHMNGASMHGGLQQLHAQQRLASDVDHLAASTPAATETIYCAIAPDAHVYALGRRSPSLPRHCMRAQPQNRPTRSRTTHVQLWCPHRILKLCRTRSSQLVSDCNLAI